MNVSNMLRLSFHKDPPTLDPQRSSDSISSAIIFLLFKGLTRLEANQVVHCDLADSFYSQNNHQKYTFLLGRHCWSDGTVITAQDFVRSWKRAMVPSFSAPAANFFNHIKNAEKAKRGIFSLDKVGIYAANDRKLIVELQHPCPYFPELTSFCPFFPFPSDAGENELPNAFSGAFQLEYWQKGKEILLKRNVYCSTPPSLDGIQIKIIVNEKQAFSLFEKDELDWLGDPISPLPVAYLPSLFSDKKIQPLAGVVSCWFNTLAEPFSNLSFRKALAYTIPRKRVLERLLLPSTLLTNNFCLPTSQRTENLLFYENEEIGRNLFNEALTMLKVKRLRITLSYQDSELFSRLAFILKRHWEEVFPLQIQLVPLPFKELYQCLISQEFQISLTRNMSQYNDVSNFLERFETQQNSRNFSGWENVKYQTLLKRYRKMTCHKKRQIIAKKAERILAEEVPMTFLYYEHYIYLQKPYLKNLNISPIGIVHFDRATLHKQNVFLNEYNPLIIMES
jgi:oligopeptide transport system substrate-binding protein